MNEIQQLGQPPIFILGVMHRSGTNFLRNLICLHPDCTASDIIHEDFFTVYSDMIVKYAASVSKKWNPKWLSEKNIDPVDSLCKHIGYGLISFLNTTFTETEISQKRLVTKTPNIRNIKYFFKLFPNAHLLIIVRDGRGVVESGVRSFDWNYEQAMRRWARAVNEISKFEKDFQIAEVKYKVVKFEDLITNSQGQLKNIFSFLGVDTDKYDFNAVESLPVRGSSELRKQQEDDIHWKPVEKTSDFDPTMRWSNWGPQLHDRFNWIAGKQMAQFGYEKQELQTNHLLWILKNILLDIKWYIKTILLKPIRLINKMSNK